MANQQKNGADMWTHLSHSLTLIHSHQELVVVMGKCINSSVNSSAIMVKAMQTRHGIVKAYAVLHIDLLIDLL